MQDEHPHDLPPGLLRTVDRALLLLLAFDRNRPELGVTEVAQEFGWDKSVAQRLLATLAHRGFLVSDNATRRYHIGPSALRLARMWRRSETLNLLIRPVLEQLTEQTGDTSILAVPDGFYLRCVCAVDGPAGPLRYHSLIGDMYPAHAGATSKAYFAFLSPDQRQHLFFGRPLGRFTDNTPVEPSALQRELNTIRERGHAFTHGEYDAGVAALAVPVFVRGELFGSLTLGAASSRFDGELGDRLDRLSKAALLTDKILADPALAANSKTDNSPTSR